MGKEDIIYGRHAVLEALRATEYLPVKTIWIGDATRANDIIREIVALAKRQNVRLKNVPQNDLDKIAAGVRRKQHQGVVASVSAYNYATIDEILNKAREQAAMPFILLLDCIQDVHNLGSLIRTAEAVGVHGVVIPKRRAVGVTPAVYKTSAGAVAHIPIAQVTNMTRTIKQLKAEDVWIAGVDMIGAESYHKMKWDMPVAVVIGGEGSGISRLVRENCDFLVKIPMSGKVESLNAAVAGAVVLYEVWRQRATRS